MGPKSGPEERNEYKNAPFFLLNIAKGEEAKRNEKFIKLESMEGKKCVAETSARIPDDIWLVAHKRKLKKLIH